MNVDIRPDRDPFDIFGDALAAAEASGLEDPNAMNVATVGEDGRPSSRMVLLKAFDTEGFVFYTNFESRKGRQVLAHPDLCLHFFWRPLGMQVHVEGRAQKVTDEEADNYFATRPHGSQVGAWASRQSRPVSGRTELLAEVAKIKLRYPGQVPRPPHWSGFRVVPTRIEFWVKGTFRLHDRTVFERDSTDAAWRTSRLFP